LIHQY